jgi:cellulose synthase operon protein C
VPFTSSQTRARLRLDGRALGLAFAVIAALGPAPARAQNNPGGTGRETRARQVPEGLSYANGLYHDHRFRMAAEEYERFLKGARPGPFADEARLGLASARFFQGQYDEARRNFEAFLKMAPNHPKAPIAWYRIGETAYMLGDLPTARKALETYTSNYPKHLYLDTAWPYLGDVCFGLGDLPKARAAYERALADYPEGRLANRARHGLGRALALQGEHEEALKVLSELAEKGAPDWSDKAQFRIGQAHAALTQYEKAVEAFEALERVAPQSPLIPEARLRRAEALIQLDRFPDAEPVLRALIEGDVSQNIAAKAAFALGTAQLEGGKPADALATLDNALGRFGTTPDAPALRFRTAEAKARLGETEEARARFLRASELYPKDPWADDALLYAARLALEARDHATARALAASFVTKFPDSPLRAKARLIEARAALATDKPRDAIAILNDSLAQDKPSPDTARDQRYYLGLAYRADGQSEKANELLVALAETPATPVAAKAQFVVGQGHIEAKQYGEAVTALEKYLSAKPDGEVADYALAYLAHARVELGQIDEAFQVLDQLTQRFPKSKALNPTRLRVAESPLAEKHHADRALELLRQVVASNDPALKAQARLHLGWLLLESGKPAEAAAEFAAALEAAPDDPSAPQTALLRAQGLEQAKQTDQALDAYAQVVAKYAQSAASGPAALARARLLVQAGKPADAAHAFEQLIKDHPDPRKDLGAGLDDLLDDWGWALIDADKTSEADPVFQRLLQEFPDSPHADDARFNLADSAHKAGNHDEVVALLAPLLADGSKAPSRLVEPALYLMGRTQAERKNWPGSAKTLERLLKDFPASRYRREARFLRAEAALQGDDAQTAEEAFAALLAEPGAPTDPPGFDLAIRRERIQALLALKRWKDVVEAAEAFKKDAPEDPLRPEIDYARGRALQSMSPPSFDEARAAYQEVIDARKGGDLAARAQLMRGETYFHQKNYVEAKREFFMVVILYDAPPRQADALLEAGKVDERLDQWADAAETYKELLAKFPNEPAAAEAKTLLEAAQKRLAGQPERSEPATAETPREPM